MKRTLIFDTNHSGHILEYLHHIYDGAMSKKNEIFIFVLSPYLIPFMDKFQWPACDNIQIIFLDEKDIKRCTKGNLLLSSIVKSGILCKYVHKFKINRVLLIYFIQYMPVLLFLLPKEVKVSGIVYRIFLYDDGVNKLWIRKQMEWVRFWLIAHSRHTSKVMMLNDNYSVRIFNHRFNTNKFVRLADPYSPTNSNPISLREELGMKENDRLFIHFGSLTQRKGILEILGAIEMLSSEERQRNYFYFAGKVEENIKAEVHSKISRLKSNGYRVELKDEFCSYEFLTSLSYSSDAVLVPYINTCQSSGLLSYAAQFHKTVIGPHKGLLGNLIKDYKLGYVLHEISASSIYLAIKDFTPIQISNDYLETNSIQRFKEVLSLN